MNKIIKMLSFAALMLGFVTSPDVSIASPGNTQLPPPPTRALQLPPPPPTMTAPSIATRTGIQLPPPPAMTASSVATQKQIQLPPPPAMTAPSVATQKQIQLPPPPLANQEEANKMLDESLETGDLNGVETAVHYGAYVNERTVDKAVSAGFVKIADYLIETVGVDRMMAFLNTYSKKILIHAIATQNIDMINLMREKFSYSINSPWNDRGESALQVALGMDAGDDIIFELLKLGANVNCGKGDSTPLYKAAQAGRVELVRELIARGAEETPGILEFAQRNRMTFNPGRALFDSTSDEPSFISDGSLSQSMEFITWPTNDDQATSGSSSSSIGSSNQQKLFFIPYGAIDAFIANPFGEVPSASEFERSYRVDQADIDLLRAIKRGDLQEVNDAISRGADVDIHPFYPLARAVEVNNKAIIDTLIQNGANVDDENGIALRTAVAKNNFDMVKYLVDVHHASVNSNSRFVHGPLSMAKAQVPQNKEIIDFLVNHGAEETIENYDDFFSRPSIGF